MKIPEFNSQKELFNFLYENKTALIAEKKYTVKHCDTVLSPVSLVDENDVVKSFGQISSTSENMRVKSVVNTTNIMDSHSDVHMPGLWNKTIKENKSIYLLQEHEMTFANIISDEVTASVKNMNWSDLGYNAEGQTQALVFDSLLNNQRNPFMFDQYAKGYVKNHSVGMQYVSLNLAMNDKSFAKEFELWNKYIGSIVNAQDAKNKGFFWAVTEAKLIEGSAVVIGSNKVTPTLLISDKDEPDTSTHKDIEPSDDTHKFIIKNFTLTN